MTIRPAAIVLADGTLFEGEAIGADAPDGVATGEFVFNTVLSGYQEVISDPSYAGQVITFTSTHIVNYGVTRDDEESPVVRCSGVVVRDLARRVSASWLLVLTGLLSLGFVFRGTASFSRLALLIWALLSWLPFLLLHAVSFAPLPPRHNRVV